MGTPLPRKMASAATLNIQDIFSTKLNKFEWLIKCLQLAMVKNRWILGSVSFSVSFCLSLLINQNLGKAFLTGLITVPATFCAVFTINRRQVTYQKFNLKTIHNKTRQLQKWEQRLRQSLSTLAASEKRSEANLNHLENELSKLSLQTTEQRQYKQQLSQELVTLSEQIRQLEAEANYWQSQIHRLEQSKGERDLSVRSLKVEKHKAESDLNALQSQRQQLQAEIAEKQVQRQQLDQDLTALKRLKPQLETEFLSLKTSIQELEQRKLQLNQSLSVIIAETQTVEAKLNSLRSHPLQSQESKPKNQAKESVSSQPSQRQRVATAQSTEKFADEWLDFAAQLSQLELQILNAIAYQDNPNAALKRIAEENITMPELLIAAINEVALETLGDLIIEPGSVPPIISDTEYLTNVQKMLKINEVN